MTFEKLIRLNNRNKNAVPMYITNVDFTKDEIILMFLDNEKRSTKYAIDAMILSILDGTMHIKNPDILKMLNYEKISEKLWKEELVMSGSYQDGKEDPYATDRC